MDYHKFMVAAKRAYDDAIDIKACIALAEASNSRDVREKLGIATLAAHMVRLSIFMKIVIVSTRVYEPVHKDDYHVAAMIEAIRKDHALMHLVEKSGQPRKLNEALVMYDEAKADHRRKLLRHSRNKLGVHLSELDPAVDPALILDLFSFGSRTAMVCERLAQGAGAMTLPIADFVADYEESAKRLWQRAAGIWKED